MDKGKELVEEVDQAALKGSSARGKTGPFKADDIRFPYVKIKCQHKLMVQCLSF